MSIQKEVLLMRHCAPEIASSVCLGQLDAPLSAAGMAHAQKIALEWHFPKPDWIVCSDLMRAQQTAAPIALRFGIAPLTDPRLRELAMGQFTGRSWDEIHESEPHALARWGENYIEEGAPGGESYLSQQARVCAAFAEHRLRPGFGLIATHQGALRVLFAQLQNVLPARAMQWTFVYGEIISAFESVLDR